MTATQLPQTVNRAIVTAGLFALLGLALYQPVVLYGALSGIFLGIGVAGLSGTPGRITLAAAVFPLGLVTLTGVVVGLAAGITAIPGVSDGSATSVYVVSATLVSGLIGLLLVATLTGEVTEQNRSNARAGTVSGVFLGTIVAAVAYGGAQQSSLRDVALVYGTGFRGFFLTVVSAAILLLLAVATIPTAALTGPKRSSQVASRKRQFTVVVLVLAGVAISVPLAGTRLGDWAVIGAVLDSAVLRGLLLSLSAISIFVAAVGGVATFSWRRTQSEANPIVAVLLGTTVGVGVPVLGGFGAGISPGLLFVVPALCGVAGIGLLLLWWGYGVLDTAGSFRESLPTLLAFLCVAGTVVIGADVGDSLDIGLAGVGATVTLGAGLFIYAVGEYGTTLTAELPAGEHGRMPQLVQVAYALSVIGISTLLAVGGFVVAMAVSPQFSFAAIVGLTGALAALVALVSYLRTHEVMPAS